MVESNSVVESKATLGHPLAAARPDLRRGIWDSGGVRTVFEPIKERLSGSVERWGKWERENWLLCWHRSRFSARKARRKDRRRERRIQIGWWESS